MRVKGIVSYLGIHYQGFQRQASAPTIQGEIERCLSELLGMETSIHGAGRTDTGVHALAQVFHFDIPESRDLVWLLESLNRLLPEDIYVKSLEEVGESFHARLSSKGKIYRYEFSVNQRDPLQTGRIAQLRRDDFEFEPFLQALKLFEGKHNFQNFTTKPEDGQDFVRTVSSVNASLSEDKNFVSVTWIGDGFMRYQIRFMMGAAIKVGLHRLSLEDIEKSLQEGPRDIVPYKAPAEGLTLVEVLYE